MVLVDTSGNRRALSVNWALFDLYRQKTTDISIFTKFSSQTDRDLTKRPLTKQNCQSLWKVQRFYCVVRSWCSFYRIVKISSRHTCLRGVFVLGFWMIVNVRTQKQSSPRALYIVAIAEKGWLVLKWWFRSPGSDGKLLPMSLGFKKKRESIHILVSLCCCNGFKYFKYILSKLHIDKDIFVKQNTLFFLR